MKYILSLICFFTLLMNTACLKTGKTTQVHAMKENSGTVPVSEPRSPEQGRAVLKTLTEYGHHTGQHQKQIPEEWLDLVPPSALDDPELFMELVEGSASMPGDILILVDKTHGLPETFVPGRLVGLSGKPGLKIARDGLTLQSDAARALYDLARAAHADGVTLVVSSAYRSWAYQDGLFSRYAARDGEEAANRYSARAGASQHQLGTAVDFGDITNAFATQKAGQWLHEHGWIYGWSLSYPRGKEEQTGYVWESWHWRWIGSHATRLQREFFNDSQQDLLEFWNAAHPSVQP